MHELAIAGAIVASAERHAGGLQVAVVRTRVGRLRQVVPEYLSFYFEVAARGTPCEGATLEWERTQSLLRCGACGSEWDPAPAPAREQDQLIFRFRCPRCESGDHRVVSGDELLIESIDVVEPAVPAPVAR
jgi:hydrogenase nickel incorporation protein HypA/HybF